MSDRKIVQRLEHIERLLSEPIKYKRFNETYSAQTSALEIDFKYFFDKQDAEFVSVFTSQDIDKFEIWYADKGSYTVLPEEVGAGQTVEIYDELVRKIRITPYSTVPATFRIRAHAVDRHSAVFKELGVGAGKDVEDIDVEKIEERQMYRRDRMNRQGTMADTRITRENIPEVYAEPINPSVVPNVSAVPSLAVKPGITSSKVTGDF